MPKRDREGVLTPRLTLGGVLRNGTLHGVALGLLLVVVAFSLGRHDDRASVLAGGMLGGAFLAVIPLPFGSFLWWASRPDVRRWRDVRTVAGDSGAATIVGPAMLRFGVTAVVAGTMCLLALVAVTESGDDSWLHGC